MASKTSYQRTQRIKNVFNKSQKKSNNKASENDLINKSNSNYKKIYQYTKKNKTVAKYKSTIN